MLVQVYLDGTARIFSKHYEEMLCEFEVSPPLKGLVDDRLRDLRIKRRERWRDTRWGSEAKIRFISRCRAKVANDTQG